MKVAYKTKAMKGIKKVPKGRNYMKEAAQLIPQFIIDIHRFLIEMTGVCVLNWNPSHWNFLIFELRKNGWDFGYNDETKRFELMVYKVDPPNGSK